MQGINCVPQLLQNNDVSSMAWVPHVWQNIFITDHDDTLLRTIHTSFSWVHIHFFLTIIIRSYTRSRLWHVGYRENLPCSIISPDEIIKTGKASVLCQTAISPRSQYSFMVIQSILTSWNRAGVPGKIQSLPGSRMVQILILHYHHATCLNATDGIMGTASLSAKSGKPDHPHVFSRWVCHRGLKNFIGFEGKYQLFLMFYTTWWGWLW